MSRDGWCRAHARTAAGAPGCAGMPRYHRTHLQSHIGTPPPGPAGRRPAKVARAAEDPTVGSTGRTTAQGCPVNAPTCLWERGVNWHRQFVRWAIPPLGERQVNHLLNVQRP